MTEFGYRVYTHWQRDGRRFLFVPEATVCHVPHFLNSVKNWAGVADGLTYLEHKHQHFDIERLRSGNRLSVQSQPQYAQYLLRPGGGSDAALKDLQDILPSNDNRLWAGGWASNCPARPPPRWTARSPDRRRTGR